MSSPVITRPCLDLAISTLVFSLFSLVIQVISCISYQFFKKGNMAPGLAHGLYPLSGKGNGERGLHNFLMLWLSLQLCGLNAPPSLGRPLPQGSQACDESLSWPGSDAREEASNFILVLGSGIKASSLLYFLKRKTRPFQNTQFQPYSDCWVVILAEPSFCLGNRQWGSLGRQKGYIYFDLCHIGLLRLAGVTSHVLMRVETS